MMFLGSTKDHKKFMTYLSTQMPLVAGVSVIVNAIKECSGVADKQTIKDALQSGAPPIIVPKNNLRSADGTKYAYAQYDPNNGAIAIHEMLLILFEKGQTTVRAPNGRHVIMAGVALLHELTHWADWLDGKKSPGEVGEMYESMIYGGRVEFPDWDMIAEQWARAHP